MSSELAPREEENIRERLGSRPIIDQIDARTLDLIQKQIAPGCTAGEVAHFLELSAHYDLDPFAHEAWIAKGRGDDGRLLIMVGRDGLRKIAQRNGLEVDGDVVHERDVFRVIREPVTRQRSVEHRYEEGFVEAEVAETSRGRIKGAWCEVWDKETGEQRGFFYAQMSEYRPTSEKKLKYSPWGSQESVMILAAAERQALRQATPLSGLLAVGEDARIVREDLTGGEGTGESSGIELSPEVEEVIARADDMGHAGWAERSTWEYTARLGEKALAARVREATDELDVWTPRISEAVVEPDISVDDADLPEPDLRGAYEVAAKGGLVGELFQQAADAVAGSQGLGGGETLPADEIDPSSSTVAEGSAVGDSAAQDIERLRGQRKALLAMTPSPDEEERWEADLGMVEEELAKAMQMGLSLS